MMRAAESVGKNSAVFAGRTFSQDLSVVNTMRGQPLTYRFCIRCRDAMRPNHANH
jgi:hypothetical protein